VIRAAAVTLLRSAAWHRLHTHPYLILRDGVGKVIVEDDDDGGALNARIVFAPTQSGTYQIGATSCDPGQAGTFEVIVSELEGGQPSQPLPAAKPKAANP
jgi:hypothetical protein